MKNILKKGAAVSVALLLAAMSGSCVFAEMPQTEDPQPAELPEVADGAMQEEISLLLQALNDALDAEKEETDNYMKKMESLRENVEDAREALIHALQNAGIEWDGSGLVPEEEPVPAEIPDTEARPQDPEGTEDRFSDRDGDSDAGWHFGRDDDAADWYFDWDDEDPDWFYGWDSEDFEWDYDDGFDWFREGEMPDDLFQGEKPKNEFGHRPGPEGFDGRTPEEQDGPAPADEAPQETEESPDNNTVHDVQEFFDKIVQAVKGFFTDLFQTEETTDKI